MKDLKPECCLLWWFNVDERVSAFCNKAQCSLHLRRSLHFLFAFNVGAGSELRASCMFSTADISFVFVTLENMIRGTERGDTSRHCGAASEPPLCLQDCLTWCWAWKEGLLCGQAWLNSEHRLQLSDNSRPRNSPRRVWSFSLEFSAVQ